MTGTEVALVLTASATFLTAVVAAHSSYRNGRKIDEVHKSTNGKMEQLLELTSTAAKAKGNLEGRQQEKNEVADQNRK